METKFWGVEVKPGQKLACDAETGKIHLKLAALGETNIKGCEKAPIFVNLNGQKLVLGTLNEEKFPQISYDLVFEEDFELSHGFKNSSVYFTGYKTELPDDDFSEEEDCPGKVKVINEQHKPILGKADVGKVNNSVAKAKAKKEESVKSDKPMVSDEDDDDDSDDEDMLASTSDSSDEETSSEDGDEDTPKKAVVSGQKRSVESASKAKVNSPAYKQKTGGDEKKSLHIATTYPAKKSEKAPAEHQIPKSSGSVICKSCSQPINSENALQAHSKAKHSGSK